MNKPFINPTFPIYTVQLIKLMERTCSMHVAFKTYIEFCSRTIKGDAVAVGRIVLT
jgi:hypothetical protein